MSEVRIPVKTMLRDTTTSTSVVRMWGRIEARGRMRPRSTVHRTWYLVPAFALFASLAVAFVWPVARHAPSAPPAPPQAAAVARPPALGAPEAPPASPARVPAVERGARAEPGTPPAARPRVAPSAAVSPDAVETWRELASRGQNDRAYAMLGQDGISSEVGSASVDDLFALADVARLSGHPRDAVPPLERIVSDHRTDVRASLAALTLGRVQLRSLALPADAAVALDAAIARGLPSGLAEDAEALLVEAWARAHEPARARAAYDHYLHAFPDGAKRTELARWITAR